MNLLLQQHNMQFQQMNLYMDQWNYQMFLQPKANKYNCTYEATSDKWAYEQLNSKNEQAK